MGETAESPLGPVSTSGAGVSSTGRRSFTVNLRRATQVGTWNVLSLSSDNYLPLLSAELIRLGISVAAFSEARRPGTG